MNFTSSIDSATTHDVPERQRIEYWEAFNASLLTGVRCSSHDPQGLDATMRRREHQRLSVSVIQGNQHIVERTPEIARKQAKDSLFVCLLLKGNAFFYQHGRCLNLEAGDLLLYDAEQPFLYGFTGQMRQLLIDLPRTTLERTTKAVHLAAPIRMDGRVGSGRTIAGTIHRAGQRLINSPDAADGDLVSQLVRMVMAPDRVVHRTHILPLAEAKNLVEERLSCRDLCPEFLSSQLGISVRHLSRLFAAEGTTTGEYIRDRRLERVHRDLVASVNSGTTIGEIAYRWGFNDLAHFARIFRKKFGISPRELQAEAQVIGTDD